MGGRDLSARFWTSVVAPALDELGGPACGAALLGPGSEVLGFDDDRSTDHDFGPRLQVIVPDGWTGDADALATGLDRLLPERFEGHAVRYPTTADPAVRHRVAVTTIAELFGGLAGLDPRAGVATSDWLALPTQILASIAAGAVFADPDDQLATARAALAWYPDAVWRHVLGCQWRRIAQREAFLGRTAEVGDELGGRLVAAGLARDLMRLAFLIERCWAPYEKWLGTAFARLDAATAVGSNLEVLLCTSSADERERAYVAAAVELAERFVALGLSEPVEVAPGPFHDRPYVVLGADRLAEACRTDPTFVALGWRGAVDQWIDSVDVLTDRSAARSVVADVLEQPTLTAGPFRVRPFELGDVDLIREVSADPGIPSGTTVPVPYSDTAARAYVERQWARAATGQGWSWAIARADTDRAIGHVGLWPRGEGRASIGYWVARSARGDGAAALAVDAVRRFAFEVIGFARLELRIEPSNVASIRTAERCGFEREGVLRQHEVIGGERRDLAMYARLAAPAS